MNNHLWMEFSICWIVSFSFYFAPHCHVNKCNGYSQFSIIISNSFDTKCSWASLKLFKVMLSELKLRGGSVTVCIHAFGELKLFPSIASYTLERLASILSRLRLCSWNQSNGAACWSSDFTNLGCHHQDWHHSWWAFWKQSSGPFQDPQKQGSWIKMECAPWTTTKLCCGL